MCQYCPLQLPQVPSSDLVLNVKPVCRCARDLLKGTLHALELRLEKPDLPLHPLLQIVLANEKFTELGDNAWQCTCHHLHGSVPWRGQGASKLLFLFFLGAAQGMPKTLNNIIKDKRAQDVGPTRFFLMGIKSCPRSLDGVAAGCHQIVLLRRYATSMAPVTRNCCDQPTQVLAGAME